MSTYPRAANLWNFNTMASAKILHITDLHIADPDGGDEYLRTGRYEGFLDKLVKSITTEDSDPFDALVATGDFVDRGATGNFGHATTILTRLAFLIGLVPGQVAVCPGNHDIVRSNDADGGPNEARAAYRGFATKFAGAGVDAGPQQHGVLYPLSNKVGRLIYCLSLDATLGCRGEDKPGTVPPEVFDALVSMVGGVPREALLVVASHYPCVTLPDIMGAGYGAPDGDSLDRHLWRDGHVIAHRISEGFKGQVLWLCGDIHSNAQGTVDHVHHVIAGRLGTRVGRDESRLAREARTIIFTDGMPAPTIIRSYLEPVTHAPQAHLINWRSEKVAMGKWSPPDPAQHIARKHKARHPKPPRPGEAATSREWRTTSIQLEGKPAAHWKRLEVVDALVQQELLELVRSGGAYQFGRFSPSGSRWVNLSWVQMGLVMNDPAFAPLLYERMARWLRLQTGVRQPQPLETTLLVGLDCWGAVLASQLALLTGALAFGLSVRPNPVAKSTPVWEGDLARSLLKGVERIVLVCDCVRTGQSIAAMKQAVDDGRFCNGAMAWWVLSVICDEYTPPTEDISFVELHGTACTSLRMPGMLADQLPDIRTLPITRARS